MTNVMFIPQGPVETIHASFRSRIFGEKLKSSEGQSGIGSRQLDAFTNMRRASALMVGVV